LQSFRKPHLEKKEYIDPRRRMKTSRTIRVTEVCSEETAGKVKGGSKQKKTHSIKTQVSPKQQENYSAFHICAALHTPNKMWPYSAARFETQLHLSPQPYPSRGLSPPRAS